MGGFLFDAMIFGPVRSRRLGNSLGINLLPVERKRCTFDCIYCECGWTPKENPDKVSLPTRNELASALEEKLIHLQEQKNRPDSITFAGNGEPTIHPEFPGIIKDTVRLRNIYFPDMKPMEIKVTYNFQYQEGIWKRTGQVTESYTGDKLLSLVNLLSVSLANCQ